MSTKSMQPLKGFQDRYPEDKALLEYIFDTVRSVATLYGFQEYDGPLVEPIELYEGKTSRELLEEQAFTLKDKKGNTLMLRPEMTPTLARMVAAKAQELTLPVRLFNIGRRFRYEAPQKGRDREFYQMDFDILGSTYVLTDIEILSVVVKLYQSFGATEKNFTVCINARDVMQKTLNDLGVQESALKDIIAVIDRKEKVDTEAFESMLVKAGATDKQVQSISELLENPAEYEKQFTEILKLAEAYDIRKYIEVNPSIVRGLDYYTGIVFEVVSKGELTRSLLGGGRYDNLVGMFGAQPISGIGFALSDTVTREFLKEASLTPDLSMSSAQALVSVFSDDMRVESIKAVQKLREAGIATDLYPDTVKLPKQFKYADRKNIPYVIVIGPEEVEKNLVTLKDMTTGEQETLPLADVITKLS